MANSVQWDLMAVNLVVKDITASTVKVRLGGYGVSGYGEDGYGE